MSSADVERPFVASKPRCRSCHDEVVGLPTARAQSVATAIIYCAKAYTSAVHHFHGRCCQVRSCRDFRSAATLHCHIELPPPKPSLPCFQDPPFWRFQTGSKVDNFASLILPLFFSIHYLFDGHPPVPPTSNPSPTTMGVDARPVDPYLSGKRAMPGISSKRKNRPSSSASRVIVARLGDLVNEAVRKRSAFRVGIELCALLNFTTSKLQKLQSARPGDKDSEFGVQRCSNRRVLARTTGSSSVRARPNIAIVHCW